MSQANKQSAWVVEADEATFQQVAVERSREVLVLVDFWATWCQPCRLLGPILEKLAEEYAGAFVLVKAETEKVPNIAAAFGVQSIPAVYALRDGQLVDYFVGLLGEPEIRALIDRLLPTPAERLVAEARQLAASDPQAARAKYAEASRLDPNLACARIEQAQLALVQGQTEEARGLVAELEKRGFLEPEAERLKAQLHLAASGSQAVDLDALRSAVAANPKDGQAALALAEGLAAAGKHEEALDTALALVSAGDKQFTEPARALMVDIFRLLPDDSPLVTEYRRRLSTALY